MGDAEQKVIVIGAGLAGCEAALQLAKRGISVDLYEMRPHKTTGAHSTQNLAEFVCSNSLGSFDVTNASGLLKKEMERVMEQNKITVAGTASPSRDIAVVTAEIKELNRQAQKMALVYAVEIGRRLCEAKEMLEHGEWGKWLKEEVDFSQSTANNCMKLFREYGAEQITLFGAVTNSQAFENLPYTKALQLLAIPAEEREEFAREVGADELSSRELAAVIKERDEARNISVG